MSTPPLNPPSFRRPFTLADDTPPDVKEALEFTYNGLLVHEQAFKALKAQVNTAQSTATAAVAEAGATSIGVTSFNTLAGNVTFYPRLGYVNDQLGQPAYTTQSIDNGAKIIVGDSSTVAVTLNASVGIPWFTIIDNDSSAVANLSASSGAVFGEQSIPGGGFGIVFFDGSNFWCGATPNAIGIDSTVTTAKLTGGGSNGSLTFINGLCVSSTQAT